MPPSRTNDFKSQWISALRSGEYQQTQSVFMRESQDSKSFCCLGVACELLGIEMYSESPSCNDLSRLYEEVPELFHSLGPSQLFDTLVLMNDRGSSFAEIADYLQSHLVQYS